MTVYPPDGNGCFYDGEDESDDPGIEAERPREIERPDHHRRHDHRRNEPARHEARAQRLVVENRETDERRRAPRFDAHEGAGEAGRGEEQSQIDQAETAAPEGHGEGIGGERQGEQNRSR